MVEAAPRDVVEAPDEDRDGEVYLDVHFDPLKALASAARALRRALASLFGGGGKSASGASASADAPSAVEAACPGALATAARAARRALATGRPVLVVAAPPASAAAEELAAAVKALGSDAVLLDATRTAQTYARAARLASAAMPAALPKNAPFCALAVPAGAGQLRFIVVMRDPVYRAFSEWSMFSLGWNWDPIKNFSASIAAQVAKLQRCNESLFMRPRLLRSLPTAELGAYIDRCFGGGA